MGKINLHSVPLGIVNIITVNKEIIDGIVGEACGVSGGNLDTVEIIPEKGIFDGNTACEIPKTDTRGKRRLRIRDKTNNKYAN